MTTYGLNINLLLIKASLCLPILLTFDNNLLKLLIWLFFNILLRDSLWLLNMIMNAITYYIAFYLSISIHPLIFSSFHFFIFVFQNNRLSQSFVFYIFLQRFKLILSINYFLFSLLYSFYWFLRHRRVQLKLQSTLFWCIFRRR